MDPGNEAQSTVHAGSSYVSIIVHRIEQEEFIGLNTKLEALLINLDFYVRLVLSYIFETRHASGGERYY